MNPIIFGKMDLKPRDFADFKAIFEVLKFLNDGLANGTAKAVYQKLLGNTWWAKFKVHMKVTGKKIKAGFKKAGAHIKGAFNKIGKATIKGGKKIGAHVKAGLKVKGKAGVKAKGGLKLKAGVKAPKLKVKAKIGAPKLKVKAKAGGKAKVGAKAKGGLKLKAGAKGKAKVGAKGKAKVGLKVKAKPSLKVKAKVGVKKRRLQAAKPAAKPATPAKSDDTKGGFLPPLPTGDKKDNKPAANTSDAVPSINVDAKGLPVSQYSGDVDVPKDLSGDSDQTAPKTANLVKLCFMLFAALLTMY